MDSQTTSLPNQLHLSPETLFGELLTELQQLFTPSIDHFHEWKQQRQSLPESTPTTWEPFNPSNPTNFLFLVETAHTIVSRTILAKRINPDAPNEITKINQRIENVFPQLAFDDVYSWWIERTTEQIQTIIGNIFTNISDLSNDILGHLYQHVIDIETKKRLGSFYTPSDIVEHMMENTRQNGKNKQRIIDPSCGSGRFILPFLQQNDKHERTINPIGIDIDPFAVFVARIRYAETLIQESVTNTQQIIPIYKTDTLLNLFNNSTQSQLKDYNKQNYAVQISDSKIITLPKNTIKSNPELCYDIYKEVCRISPNSDKTTSEIIKHIERKYDYSVTGLIKQSVIELISLIVSSSTKIYNRIVNTILGGIAKQFLKYDLVIGNPPYVNIKNITTTKTEKYRDLYDTASGRFDLYVLFIERGLNMLNENGELMFITSNKFMRTSYGKKLRDKITTDYTINSIVNFGGVDVFSTATTMTSIISIYNQPPRTNERIDFTKVIDGDAVDSYNDVIHNTTDDGVVRSVCPQSSFTTNHWNLASKPVRNITAQINSESVSTLSDECLGIRQGVSSGCDDVFVVTDEIIDENDLEPDIIEPLVFGSDVRRWHVNWSGKYAIYPYTKDGKLVDYDEYPNTKQYLEQHTEELQDRYCVRKGSASIYEYDGPRHNSVYEGTWKIASPDISSHNNFTDTNGFDCFKNTVYVITFDENILYTKEMILGVLNSPIVEFLIDQKSPQLQGKRRRYKSQYLKEIPLPSPSQSLHNTVKNVLDGTVPEQEAFECVKESFGLTDEQYKLILSRTGRK